jgi:hypothetical protein
MLKSRSARTSGETPGENRWEYFGARPPCGQKKVWAKAARAEVKREIRDRTWPVIEDYELPAVGSSA